MSSSRINNRPRNMIVNTIIPTNAEELDTNKTKSSSKNHSWGVRDCGFRRSAFYHLFKYIFIYTELACVYLHPCCVCEEPQVQNEGNDNGSPRKDRSDFNGTKTTFVRTISRSDNVTNVVPLTCANADSPFRSRFKKISCCVMTVCHLSTPLRYIGVIQTTKKDTNSLMFTVFNFSVLQFYFYLFFFNTYACYRYFTPCIKAMFAYETKYRFGPEFHKLHHRYLLAAVCLLICQLGQVAFFVFGTIEFFDGMRPQLWPLLQNDEKIWRIGVSITVAIGIFFAGCIQYGIGLLRALITAVLHSEFHRLETELADSIGAKDITTCPKLDVYFDKFMEHFRCLTQLTDTCYDMLKHAIAASYMFPLPIICLVLFGVISDSIKPDQYLIFAFTTILCLFAVCHTTLSLAGLRNQIHAICDVMYTADFSKLSEQTLQKVTLFTNMFQTRKFGMAVYGLFVVDNSTLLMVGGTLLTYGVVVVQFQVGTSTVVCHIANVTI